MFKKLKIKIVNEIIRELEYLFEQYDDQIICKGFADQDNTLEFGIAMGIRKSIEKVMDIKLKILKGEYIWN